MNITKYFVKLFSSFTNLSHSNFLYCQKIFILTKNLQTAHTPNRLKQNLLHWPFFSSVIESKARPVKFFPSHLKSVFLMVIESEQKDYPGVSFQEDDKQGAQGLQVLLFSVVIVDDEHQNLGSKESVGIKFKEGIYTKFCLKLWFDSNWYFCKITESGWFWKWLSTKEVLNNHFLKSLQKQPYTDVPQNRCS